MKGQDRELIEKLIGTLERMQLDRYVEHVSNQRRMIGQNLLYGVVRGLGFSLGFSVLGALLIALLNHFWEHNMPQISGFIAEVIHAIQERL